MREMSNASRDLRVPDAISKGLASLPIYRLFLTFVQFKPRTVVSLTLPKGLALDSESGMARCRGSGYR